jgi:hypothetical protein
MRVKPQLIEYMVWRLDESTNVGFGLCKNLGLSRHVCIVFFPAQPIAMFTLSICSSYGWITQPQTCYWLFERKYNTHVTR